MYAMAPTSMMQYPQPLFSGNGAVGGVNTLPAAPQLSPQSIGSHDQVTQSNQTNAVPFIRRAVVQSRSVSGAFALQNGVAKTQAHLDLNADQVNPLSTNVHFWLSPPNSPMPITHYDVEMQKYAHVIIVSDDFRWFAHVHPTLQSDGRFVLSQQFPHPGLYHIYADTVPHGIGQQVFRFDVDVAGTSQAVKPAARENETQSLRQSDGPFAVVLATNHVKAGQTSMVDLTILDQNQPAEHLQPFLGVGAHVIVLNEKDLSYEHTHPMPMNMAGDASMSMDDMMKHMPVLQPGDSIDPYMMIHVKLSEPGNYRMWLQFKDEQQKIHTVSFPLTAE